MLHFQMTAPSPHSVAVFGLDDRLFALDVAKVQEVVRAVEIVPVPGAMSDVCGVINVRGQIILVFDLRTHFGCPLRPVRASDYLVLVHSERGTLALLADAVLDIVSTLQTELIPANRLLPGLQGLDGVMPLPGGIVFIHDIEGLLEGLGETGGTVALPASEERAPAMT